MKGREGAREGNGDLARFQEKEILLPPLHSCVGKGEGKEGIRAGLAGDGEAVYCCSCRLQTVAAAVERGGSSVQRRGRGGGWGTMSMPSLSSRSCLL